MPSSAKRPGRWKTWIAVWVIVVLLGGAMTAYDVLYRYPDASGPGDGVELQVEIPKGIGPEALVELLHSKGLIKSPGRFKMWMRYTGSYQTVKAGSFVLVDDMTPREIFAVLSGRGDNRGVRVTIPEGFTLSEIAEALEDAGITSIEQFYLVVLSSKELSSLGISAPSAEGFLFPDTYYFAKNTPAGEVVKRMHDRFKSKWKSVSKGEDANLFRTITLASIVQAEAKIESEMPTIAGVYENRLKSPDFPSRLLQADPAVAYGCEPGPHDRAPSCDGFIGRLRRRQLDDPKNPYNTYKHPGLPPGPICAPGEAAIKAALSPAKVPYLFFVAGPGGKHRFSETLAEHNKAVDLYLEGR